MNSLPSRRSTPSNQITNSLNRLASSNYPSQPSRSLPTRIFLRASRSIRLLFILLTIVLFFFFFLYWPQSALKKRISNAGLFSKLTKSNISNPDFWAKIPTVSREVLSVLEELDQSQLNDEEKAIQEMHNQPPLDHPGLPLVTTLPSDLRHPSSTKPNCPDNLSAPCRFLIAGFIGEQETKAQIHLHQLGLLAMALNRTLVLPQLSHSRMGSCLEHPFNLYYNENSLNRLGVRTVTHEKFLRWATATTSYVPTARLVAIVDHKQIPSTSTQGSIYYDPATTTTRRDTLSFVPNRQFCIRNNLQPSHLKKSSAKEKLYLNFQDFAPLIIVSPARWQKSTKTRDQFAQQIIKSMQLSDSNPSDKIVKRYLVKSDESRQEVPDVLVVNYELRYPILDPRSNTSQTILGGGDISSSSVARNNNHHSAEIGRLKAFEHFPYASVWEELAQVLVEQLPAMVGIHWRQENMKVMELQRCARSLIVTLDSLKNSYPSLEAVYLSTDYPIEQAVNDGGARQSRTKAHSGTFSKLITQDHHAIMRELFQHPIALKWFTFNTLIERLSLSVDLLEKLLRQSVFRKVKEMDRLMRVRMHADLREMEGGADWGRQDRRLMESSRQELERAVKVKLTLSPESSTETGMHAEEEGEDQGMDMGVIGILEKLILIRSSLFLTGVPNQCSKLSSFTNQIVDHRLHLIDDNLAQFGFLLDSDFPGNSQPNRQRFNLVEFWGPSP
ncbi:hypothetical protein VP01_578g7 [Puccinia sorghi]|uniref:Uncharacterized protein n=1 Tax=Puccinia sorghi TaxID=27349 RepID=A0A0L6UI99_9BASI|nr:hypothetical protein VP01_578g7 [Puccinia sorghi]